MGKGQNNDGNGTEKDGKVKEEGWEWGRGRMGVGQKKDGKEKEQDRKGTKESLERTVEGWEGQKKIRKVQKKCVHVTEER
jgi:hypothetical protein